MTADPLARLRDVFVAFPRPSGAVMALRGADLEVAVGERLLVQGPTGSGKSTLLKVITGEQPVAAGTVQVGGSAVHALTATQRRSWRAGNVGLVDQHGRRNLLLELSVLDNVGLQLRLTGTSGAAARSRAGELLEALGADELRSRKVFELSGGEVQRVAICAAVAHAPQLVLADEPTGELDEQSAQQVYEMLTRIAAEGTSVILVSHDTRALAYVDRAVRVRDGRISEQWRPGDSSPEQVPDSRGWVRIPSELWPAETSAIGPVATRHGDGVALRPGPAAAVPDAGAPAAERTDPGARAGPPRHGLLLVFSRVTAGYSERQLFGPLDLELSGGDWLAVTGHSGSGKTTLLSLVVGLADPRSGSIRLAGVPWYGLDRDSRAGLRRAQVAYAPQRVTLVEPLTVAENLQLTMAVRGARRGPEVTGEMAARLGLESLLEQPVEKLSGGERQRVAIARAIISDAPLLVLDEPTSQQDEVNADVVIAVLAEERNAGRAVLVASHDPRLLRRAERSVALTAG